MFQSDWLILRILHQLFEIERPKGHWSEFVVHLNITHDNFCNSKQECTLCLLHLKSQSTRKLKLSYVLSYSLSIVFRKSLDLEVLHDEWKSANMTAVFKKGVKKCFGNY